MLKRMMKLAAFGIVAAVMISNTTLPVSAGILSDSLPSAGAGSMLNKTVEITEVATAAPAAPAAAEVAAPEVKEEAAPAATPEVTMTAGVTAAATVTPQENAVFVAETELEKEEKEYVNLVIAKCNDYVNVRQEPSEEAEILGKLYDKSVGEFVSEADGGWYEITSGSVTGFVKAEYVVTGEEAIELAKEVRKRIATVTTTTLFVREEPSTEARTIGMVPIEDELTVIEEEGLDGWVKVSVEEGEGYVSAEFVTLSTEFVKAESKAEEEARLKKEEEARRAANAAADKKSGKSSSSSSGAAVSGGSGRGAAVASFALQFVGNPYVYGGSSLTNGTDCSGFVMAVYSNFGVGLPHSSGAQRGCGYDVGGIGNAQPGDIVCYSGHVGIYIGGGQIVHASTAATGIKVSNATYRNILSVRRIF
ncbi:MAG: SH3 domain-containing protein [Lachnospiraceae bacterium]|nr:SH3 domain-containing protein [Lachnospiraceae bacterium]